MAAQQNVNPVEQARQRLLAVERKLNEIVVGHEDFIRALMLSVVSGEHIVVIGPPGTAKSYAIRVLSDLLNAKFYKYLLTRFTSYDELFGTVDIATLARDGVFKRNWSGIVSADFVFLDEVFKANSAILNALLSLLQERIVYDPMTGQAIPAKLHTAIGASNETPEDPELQALYDRFAIKVFVDYLGDDKLLLRALEARWLNNSGLQPLATMDDVRVLHSYAEALLAARIRELGEKLYKIYHVNMVPLVKSLRSRGVSISDRTIVEKLPKLFTAYLVLYGITADNIFNAVFEVIVFTARSREEVSAIRKAMDEALGEVGQMARALEDARRLVRTKDLEGAKKKLNDEIFSKSVESIAQKAPWMRARAEAIIAEARRLMERISQWEREMEAEAAGESR
jgi:MoxR-like ATPase